MKPNNLLVSHHAGNILVESQNNQEFLCNIYDNTHPVKTSRGRLNFIGGGKGKEDLSPLVTVQREVNEEFSLAQNNKLDESTIQDAGGTYELPKIGEMASLEDIEKVKKGILENLVPYQDFLITLKSLKNGPNLKNPNVIFNVFYSKIPQEYFEIARKNLDSDKSLVNDGFLKIVSIEDLVKGIPLTSWACGRIFEHYLQREMPNPESTTAKPLGKPRKFYSDYLKDFKYIRF